MSSKTLTHQFDLRDGLNGSGQGHRDGGCNLSRPHSRHEQGSRYRDRDWSDHSDRDHSQSGPHPRHEQDHRDGGRNFSGHRSHNEQGPRYVDRDWSGHRSRPEQGHCDGRRHWSGPHSHHEQGQRHEGRDWSGPHPCSEQSQRDRDHGQSGPHPCSEQRQRDRDHCQSGPHQLPEQGHKYTPHVLNQLLWLIYQVLLQSCVSLEALVQSEQNPTLHADMQSFLQESGACLYDAFRRIGLVQTTDGSWSAPESWSLLSSFPAFFASVVGAFSNSIFHFLNATLETRTVNVGGVPTTKYSFNTSNGKIVSAIGVLFYSKDKGFLMQSVRDEKSGEIRFTDFGGKVELKDMTCLHSLYRETNEETNGLLTPDYDFLKMHLGHIYLLKCKYLLLICRAPAEFEGIDPSQFGTHEEHSSTKRTVQWVSRSNFLDAENLHQRLSISPEVKAKISELFPQ